MNPNNSDPSGSDDTLEIVPMTLSEFVNFLSTPVSSGVPWHDEHEFLLACLHGAYRACYHLALAHAKDYATEANHTSLVYLTQRLFNDLIVAQDVAKENGLTETSDDLRHALHMELRAMCKTSPKSVVAHTFGMQFPDALPHPSQLKESK